MLDSQILTHLIKHVKLQNPNLLDSQIASKIANPTSYPQAAEKAESK
jgi:hypothetical protein